MRTSNRSYLIFNFRYFVRDAVIVILVTLALVEVAVRLLSTTTPVGLYWFYTVPLPPLRPTEARARQAIEASSDGPLLVRDPDIGWITKPNRSVDGDETNTQGIRTAKDHLLNFTPPHDKIRIETVGDSYVYCLQVKNGETWQDYLARQHSDLEFINFGIAGAGTDQAFLRWSRDGRKFHPDIVILGIWPDNINRNLILVDFYRGQFGVSLNKPRLILDTDGGSRFVNYPIMSNDALAATVAHPEDNPILKHDFWYNHDETLVTPLSKIRLAQLVQGVWYRYQRKLTYQKIFSGEISEGLDVTFAIAKQFADEVDSAGAIPVILMIPDRTRLDMVLGSKSKPLITRMRDAGINVIDMGPTFGAKVKRDGPAKYYVDGVGHHSPYGNQVFAMDLDKELAPYVEKVKARKNLIEPKRMQ
jgi:hypothetical protein